MPSTLESVSTLRTLPATSSAERIRNAPVASARQAFDLAFASTADSFVDVDEKDALWKRFSDSYKEPGLTRPGDPRIASLYFYLPYSRGDGAIRDEQKRTTAEFFSGVRGFVRKVRGQEPSLPLAAPYTSTLLRHALAEELGSRRMIARLLADLPGGGRVIGPSDSSEGNDLEVNRAAFEAFEQNVGRIQRLTREGTMQDPLGAIREVLEQNIRGSETLRLRF